MNPENTFTYDPAEANPDLVLPAGTYNAFVVNAEVGKTQKGDPKMCVTLKVFGDNGDSALVFDHLTRPWGIRRLKQLCGALGVDFDTGGVDPSQFRDQDVRVSVGISVDPSEQFPDKNYVRQYLKPNLSGSESDKPKQTPF